MKTPPAQLWIGEQKHLIKKTKQYLQELHCPNSGCRTCTICNQIDSQQHHCAIWLKPEKYYTLEQLEIIFKTISFQMDDNQKLFFIIQNADFLTPACSNSLLKSVEEPPTGYHFIFLAERLSQMLPTIQSRCIIKTFYSEDKNLAHGQLVQLFTASKTCPPADFLKLLNQENPNEKESVEMLDQILAYWITQSNTAICQNDMASYQAMVKTIKKIKKSMLTPPMPGSGKLFWKNLYLELFV